MIFKSVFYITYLVLVELLHVKDCCILRITFSELTSQGRSLHICSESLWGRQQLYLQRRGGGRTTDFLPSLSIFFGRFLKSFPTLLIGASIILVLWPVPRSVLSSWAYWPYQGVSSRHDFRGFTFVFFTYFRILKVTCVLVHVICFW